MRILVIDDLPRNQESARKLLGADHELTICCSIAEVFKLLVNTGRDSDFDVVLTDMMMPYCNGYPFASVSENLGIPIPFGEEYPIGIFIALRFAQLDIPTMVISDKGSHEDFFASCTNIMWVEPVIPLNFLFFNSISETCVGNHKFGGENTKDWKKALDILLKDEICANKFREVE
jgi:CheY-like chemotaxis protein